MTLLEFQAMTAEASKLLADRYPGVVHLVILSDGKLECCGGSVPEPGEALAMLMAAFEQLVRERQSISHKVGRA